MSESVIFQIQVRTYKSLFLGFLSPVEHILWDGTIKFAACKH